VQVLQTNLPRLREEMQKTTGITEAQAKAIEQLNEDWAKLGETLRTWLAEEYTATKSGLGQLWDRIKGFFAGSPDSVMEFGAPKTGRIRGLPGGGLPYTNVPGNGELPNNTFIGGNLGPSNAILEQLRAIRRNTEAQGAVLE
jgi:hypothetical protein